MSKHHCHALKCSASCPPKWLMCKPHWSKVPDDMQREVYRTVGLRGQRIDSTWAPWWRAAHLAIHHVAKMEFGERLNPKWIEKEMKFADTLEAKP